MARTVRKQKFLSPISKKKIEPSLPSAMEIAWQSSDPKLKYVCGVIAAIAALFVLYSVNSTNGFAGFPIDDSWIHLTFARTLATTGHFAYGALNTTTSGSTSPLFTFIEAIFFLVTKNEFVVALIPCIVAFAASASLFYLLVREFTSLPWVPVAATLLFILTPSLLVISNWGMETSLTIMLLLWSLLLYRRERWDWLALVMGLAIWSRPDTGVLVIGMGLDYLYTRKAAPSKPGVKAVLIVCSIVVLYACFNYVLSGTVLPNTFYAKLAYYKSGNTNFWAQLWLLIAGGGRIITFVLAAGGIAWMFTEKKRGNIVLILYPLSMIFLYHWKLPYLYQDGRYLIPILPFLLLLATIGSTRTASWLAKSPSSACIVSITLILAAAIGVFNRMSDTIDNLSFEDSYIHNLQVETAQWCAKNLPASAVITTHDIGALGYYSGRRVVDLVGLADPSMIKFLDKPGAVSALRKKGVSYAALLDNWYEIPNENTVFVNSPPASETMRVYYFTDSTRFTGGKVLPIHKYLYNLLHGDDPSAFNEAMKEAIAAEPDNALTYTLGGEVLLRLHKLDAAKAAFQKALMLFPSSTRAMNGLSQCSPRK
jgi:hypothetical protein